MSFRRSFVVSWLTVVGVWGCQAHGGAPSVPPHKESAVAESYPLPSAQPPRKEGPSGDAATVEGTGDRNQNPKEVFSTLVSRTLADKEAACGLDSSEPLRLVSIVDGKVVVSRSLHGVERVGLPKIIFEPDDHAEYFMAEQRIDRSTLPKHLKRLEGADVAIVGEDSLCWTKLGEISAYAWADEEADWPSQDLPVVARRLFRDGGGFLAAPVAKGPCEEMYARLAVLAPPRTTETWSLRKLETPYVESDSKLVQMAFAQFADEPSLDAVDHRYQRFLRETKDDALPQDWWELPPHGYYSHLFSRNAWSLATNEHSGAALLVFGATARAEQGESTFYAEQFVVSCVTKEGALIVLGAFEMNGDLDYLTVLGIPGKAPTIIQHQEVMQLRHDAYEDVDYDLGHWPRVRE